MKSTMIGASDIRLGDVDIALTGGMENMSMAPYLLKGARFGYRLGDGKLYDHLVNDGLTCIFNNYHMGQTAENIAEEYGITREEQDLFSLESQKRTDKAIKEDRFREEIVPVEIKTRKKQIIFDTDEHPKGDTTMEILGKLRTVFKKDGSVTAGNASGINDGASMTVIMSEEKMNELNIKPLVEIVSYSQSGVAPKIMGMGPVEAVDLALEKANLKLEDVGLFELNEAFAVQSIAVMRQMAKRNGVSEEWLNERTNVNGGAISLGHPIGCSGNRILVTLIYEMKKRKVKYGLAALCIGGGMGTAMIIRNTEV
jgi:acetyl-CoA C-acetyltransferase